MQVELTNFRCWKKKTFQFNDNGMILINGTSGSGKSSILNAIYFAITGVGTKIVTYNEKKCSVKLSFESGDIHEIYRTKNPCRLVITLRNKEQNILEDEEAQKYINSVFGDNFQHTSYMTQKMIHSFLSLTPNEKMNFLQKIIYNDTNPENNINEIKRKCKDTINTLKKQSIEYTSKISIYNNELGIVFNKIKDFIHEGIKDNEDLELYIKTLPVIEYNPDFVKIYRKELLVLKQEYDKYYISIIKLNELSKQKDMIIKDIEEVTNNISIYDNYVKNTLYKGDVYYQNLLSNKHHYKIQNDNKILINKINTDYSNIITILKEQKTHLHKEQTKIVNLRKINSDKLSLVFHDVKYIQENIDKWIKSSQTICEYYNFVKDISFVDVNLLEINIKELENEIASNKILLSNKQNELNKITTNYSISKQLHKCPKCSVYLRIQSNNNKHHLTVVNNDNIDISDIKNVMDSVQNDIILIENTIQKLSMDLNKKKNILDNYSNNISKLENYRKRLNRADPIILKYLDFKYCDMIETKDTKDFVYNVNDVNRKINEIQTLLKDHIKYESEYNDYTNNINIVNNDIENINNINISDINIRDNHKLRDIYASINKLNNKNTSVNKLLKQLQRNITQLQDNIYTDDADNTLLNNISDIMSEEEVDNNLIEQTKLKSQYENYKIQLDQTHNKLKSLTSKLNCIQEEIDNTQIYVNENSYIIQKYNDTERKINECYKNEEEYNKYNNIFLLYKQWRRLYNERRVSSYLYDVVSNDIVVHEIFLNKINESESIALSNCIDSINYYINDYLEKFFPNDSIIVDIIPFKEKKNTNINKTDIKACIDIRVCYKGEEVDLSSLSGGEYDRVALAIMLSFNNLSKSNMILLDESIASLDADLTVDILEKLKDNVKEKRIIVVAHQLSTGMFDQIVNTQ